MPGLITVNMMINASPTGYDIRPDSHIFWPSLISQKEIGKHFACTTQVTSGIPGQIVLAKKNLVAELAKDYVEKFQNRTHCINNNKLFPESWLLYQKSSCLEFFEKLNSEEYKKLKEERGIVYIRKVGSLHKGEGVFPVVEEEENSLRTKYENGSLCGRIKNDWIIQHFIHNPSLVDGRKFDLRAFMLVASSNPLIAFYHDGPLRVTLESYDTNKTDRKALITNIALNKDIYSEARKGNLYKNMTEDELKYAQQWTIERLEEHFLKNKMVDDPNWFNNYLRPEFKKAMIHILRLSSKNLTRRSSVYGLFAIDFVLDENMDLWILEVNESPLVEGYPEAIQQLINTILGDSFRITMALIRSRAKRIIQYVNKLTQEMSTIQEGTDPISVEDLPKRIEEFKSVIRNKFEKEFEVTDTTFSIIADGNLNGTERFFGYVKEECL